MTIFIGNTDPEWYRFLSQHNITDEVNFWRPSGRNVTFRAIASGEFFFFRLRNPISKIVGFGSFATHSVLPIIVAWETFGEANGCGSLSDLIRMIAKYRNERPDFGVGRNWMIGCTILTNIHYYSEQDWLDFHFAQGIVQGKSLDESSEEGKRVWQHLQAWLERRHMMQEAAALPHEPFSLVASQATYQTVPVKERRGQGAFRVLILNAYKRRCCVTGERTLPVIEAAHIQTYISPQSNHVQNGLALREDIHTLFDEGYVGVDESYKFIVRPRLREVFDNGRDYYKLHGKPICLPDQPEMTPSKAAIRWHLEKVYVP